MHDDIIKTARRRPLYVPDQNSTLVDWDREVIGRALPHRSRMLLVDRVDAVDLQKPAIRAYHHIDPGSPFLDGHFPGEPIYPGALLLEAMGQASLVLHALLQLGRPELRHDDRPQPVRLLRILHALFQKEARPGDEVTLIATRLSTDAYTMVAGTQAMRGSDILAVSTLEVFLVEEEE